MFEVAQQVASTSPGTRIDLRQEGEFFCVFESTNLVRYRLRITLPKIMKLTEEEFFFLFA